MRLRGLSKLLPTRRYAPLFLVLVTVLVGVGVTISLPSLAFDIVDEIYTFINTILNAIVEVLGGFLLWLIGIMLWIVSYNGFTDSAAVTYGWVAVRDVANMFFIVILLVLAVATIVQYQNYHYKKFLPRLLIMAVLINFSKTIAGIFIDFAQVILMTFFSAFREAAGGNLIELFGITNLITFQKTGSVGQSEIMGAFALAIVFLIIAIVVVSVYLIVFAFRIVALWLLVVLSPLAFFLSTFSRGQKYHAEWWEEFVKYVITGPVLAFFLWLALAVSSYNSEILPQSSYQQNIPVDSVAQTESGTPEKGISFIMGIAFLVGGLMMTQRLGVAGGGLAGKAVSGIKDVGIGAVKGAGKVVYGAGVGVGLAGKRGLEKLGIKPSPKLMRIATGVATLGGSEIYRGGKALAGIGDAYKAEKMEKKKFEETKRAAIAKDRLATLRGEPQNKFNLKELEAKEKADSVKKWGTLSPQDRQTYMQDAVKKGDKDTAKHIMESFAQEGSLGNAMGKVPATGGATPFEKQQNAMLKALTGKEGDAGREALAKDEGAKSSLQDMVRLSEKNGDYRFSGMLKEDEEGKVTVNDSKTAEQGMINKVDSLPVNERLKAHNKLKDLKNEKLMDSAAGDLERTDKRTVVNNVNNKTIESLGGKKEKDGSLSLDEKTLARLGKILKSEGGREKVDAMLAKTGAEQINGVSRDAFMAAAKDWSVTPEEKEVADLEEKVATDLDEAIIDVEFDLAQNPNDTATQERYDNLVSVKQDISNNPRDVQAQKSAQDLLSGQRVISIVKSRSDNKAVNVTDLSPDELSGLASNIQNLSASLKGGFNSLGETIAALPAEQRSEFAGEGDTVITHVNNIINNVKQAQASGTGTLNFATIYSLATLTAKLAAGKIEIPKPPVATASAPASTPSASTAPPPEPTNT